MSLTLVWSLTHLLVCSVFISDVEHVSFHVMLCYRNLFSIFVVNVQVSAPYVIARRIQWSKTFLCKHVDSVPFIIVLCLPNACHPVLILLPISLSWFFPLNILFYLIQLHILPWLFLWFLPATIFVYHVQCQSTFPACVVHMKNTVY